MRNDHTSTSKDLTTLTREEMLQAMQEMDKDQFLLLLSDDHYKKYAKRPR